MVTIIPSFWTAEIRSMQRDGCKFESHKTKSRDIKINTVCGPHLSGLILLVYTTASVRSIKDYRITNG